MGTELSENFVGRGFAGELEIDGCTAADLVRQFGAPLWIISQRQIEANYRSLSEAFVREYPRTSIVYAAKANSEPAVLRILRLQGAMLDAVSVEQLVVGEAAGFQPSDIVLNGNAKTQEELEWAVRKRPAYVNVDSLEELNLLARLQPARGDPLRICLRLAGDPSRHSADPGMAATLRNSKFGMTEDEAVDAVRFVGSHAGLRVAGLHNHVGFSTDAGYTAARDLQRHSAWATQVMEFAARLRQDHGVSVETINLGGGYRQGRAQGFGPRRLRDFPTAEDYARAVAGPVASFVAASGGEAPRLLIEPGGFLVADAVLLLARVSHTKSHRGGGDVRRWALLERTSAYHFVRRLMQDFYHHVEHAGAIDGKPIEIYELAGATCATDTVANGVALPLLERGDIVAIFDQGAYCESITTDYCLIPPPSAALVCDGQAALSRRRQSPDDLLERYLIPQWLKPTEG